eukprot:6001402-Amphidinium_carterae.1
MDRTGYNIASLSFEVHTSRDSSRKKQTTAEARDFVQNASALGATHRRATLLGRIALGAQRPVATCTHSCTTRDPWTPIGNKHPIVCEMRVCAYVRLASPALPHGFMGRNRGLHASDYEHVRRTTEVNGRMQQMQSYQTHLESNEDSCNRNVPGTSSAWVSCLRSLAVVAVAAGGWLLQNLDVPLTMNVSALDGSVIVNRPDGRRAEPVEDE